MYDHTCALCISIDVGFSTMISCQFSDFCILGEHFWTSDFQIRYVQPIFKNAHDITQIYLGKIPCNGRAINPYDMGIRIIKDLRGATETSSRKAEYSSIDQRTVNLFCLTQKKS